MPNWLSGAIILIPPPDSRAEFLSYNEKLSLIVQPSLKLTTPDYYFSSDVSSCIDFTSNFSPDPVIPPPSIGRWHIGFRYVKFSLMRSWWYLFCTGLGYSVCSRHLMALLKSHNFHNTCRGPVRLSDLPTIDGWVIDNVLLSHFNMSTFRTWITPFLNHSFFFSFL